jgi:hypothetical protein
VLTLDFAYDIQITMVIMIDFYKESIVRSQREYIKITGVGILAR